MNEMIDVFAPSIGRILLGGYFLWSGIQATLNFPASVAQIAALGLPWPVVISLILIAVEVLGGLAVVTGVRLRAAALVLVLYTLTTGLMTANFLNPLEQALFLQSFAVIGGLLYLAAAKEKSWR